MKTKDFSKVNTDRVYSAITEATAAPDQGEATTKPRRTYNAEETLEMQEAGTTQGRKGCKAKRINMAFTPENYRYIFTMSRIRGESLTQFLNAVIRRSIADNQEVYEQAKKLTEKFK